MDVIFLDIDGVLRTHKSDLDWSLLLNKPIPQSVYDRNFSKLSISHLNYIISLSGAKIVITSTWRTNFTVKELKDTFRNQGLNGEIVDKTTILYNRGEEIQEWLDTHDVDKYVVVDDQIKDIKIHINKNRIVEVDPSIGLEDESLVDIILDKLL